MTKFLHLLFFSFLVVSTIYGQSYKQVKIYINQKSDIQHLQNAGVQFDHLSFNKEDNSISVFADENDFAILQSSGFTYEVLIDNWKSFYESLPKLTEAQKQEFIRQSKLDYNVGGFGFGSMGGFYTLAEVIAELDTMRMLYPDLVTVKASIGNTIENRPIYMVKISDNADINENEPQVLYTALHHAREPESMMQMIYFMYYLLENYGTDPEATYLVNNRELYFVPVVNPDGYEYNRLTDPAGGGMWRKNRRNNGGGTYGIDLNRNYGPMAYWNSSYGGSSTDPGSETYRGTAPFSEPETAALRDFIGTKNFSNVLNYHTYGNWLIYPYGCFPWLTPDSLIFIEYANEMTSYNGYTAGTAIETVGYNVRGTSDDYAYDGDTVMNSGKIIAMTPEVGDEWFWPSQGNIFPEAQENLKPNLFFAWVGGEYVGIENPNFTQQYFNPGDVVDFFPIFKNKGLAPGNNIHVEFNSLSSYATVTNGSAVISSIGARESITLSTQLSFTISASTPAEEEIGLEFTTSDGSTTMRVDTIYIIIGTPEIVWQDTTNDPALLWTITPSTNPHWEATNLTYYTPPVSFTDSKSGNYLNNANVIMTLSSPIDLSLYSNPRLTFWTKYDIESNWDYGQVSVSTNNGSTWFPLSGQYTEPGVGSFQPNGEPLYDGIRTTWVKEEMSLAGHTSSQVKFRFQLRSDGFVTRDGWYVDDIAVIVYTIVPVELTQFSASVKNENVLINWSTATEMNNRGFEIQRSPSFSNSEFRNWETIGFISGTGTSTEPQYYSFTDHKPINGKSYYRLKQIDFDGAFRYYNEAEINFAVVRDYSLEQNFPNPFNPSTIITYSLPVAGFVNLTVYNLLGSEVAVLVNENKEAGIHTVEFSTEKLSNNLGSGVYIYTIRSGNFVQTRKMVIIK